MPENGIPADLLRGVPVQKFTPFEMGLLNRISSVTTALYALTVQMEAGRMQTDNVAGGRDTPKREEIEATAKHAQDAATLALNLAGVMPLVEKLGAQEAGG